MSTPIGPGWYDDPDDQKAERWWDGQAWSPNRRRKQSTFSSQAPEPPPATYFPVAPPDPLPYPGPSASTYPAYSRGDSIAGPETPPDASRLIADRRSMFGVDEAVALIFALSGLGLVASAFAVWARVSDNFSGLTASLQYPGIGDPSARVRDSEVAADLSNLIQHNTNSPGWIALVLGVALIAVAASHYFALNRKISDLAAAVLSTIVLVVCISYVSDLRGAFGDPPVFEGVDFAPGLGLIATIALSVLVVVTGVAAFIYEQRRP